MNIFLNFLDGFFTVYSLAAGSEYIQYYVAPQHWPKVLEIFLLI
jgi:hypothetical protein